MRSIDDMEPVESTDRPGEFGKARPDALKVTRCTPRAGVALGTLDTIFGGLVFVSTVRFFGELLEADGGTIFGELLGADGGAFFGELLVVDGGAE